jgi:hypothetical protein
MLGYPQILEITLLKTGKKYGLQPKAQALVPT